ncbi:MAG: 2Fe-2S iron-sulfur cluster binding domain-containing protein [Planctomycetaceae bacterium]|jgi:ferredoxin|nr:2Fe-2S iron-sulfur cluster binding domain-containing protein [Planctomycetaceae bacterium]MBT6155096.1 2Fe-2S iron-sulfur cluster binding domain-containing protein [Planctomycetaceae bacterium]MBT6483388.1 2Fe-2S iron-sulfur cluster binding domain-containing protein [Planctomycetaceae bacterium]MBT6493817.1 2Fe-2S iron-sulfur cluster binding domain-containing protein [Planctomycetaceae bacterium]
MPKVKFVKEKKEVEVPNGANLRQEARKAGVDVYPGIHKVLNCQGNGMCCSCRMNIKEGSDRVSKQGLWEKMWFYLNPIAFFARIGQEDNLRLSCQTTIHGDVEVESQPEFNWHGDKFWA